MKRLLPLLALALCASARANIPPEREEFPFPRNVWQDLQDVAALPPAGVPAPPTPAEKVLTQKDLMAMSRKRLEKLYRTLGAGPIPDGDSKGRATLSSGSGFGGASEKVLHLFWQGKVFKKIDDKHGELVNKILGAPAIKARVYYAHSLLDGRESIILDYSKSDLLVRGIRDEIRQAAPGLYFGYAYIHGPFGWTKKPLIFALDFNK